LFGKRLLNSIKLHKVLFGNHLVSFWCCWNDGQI